MPPSFIRYGSATPINRLVIALEDDWPVSVAAARRLAAPMTDYTLWEASRYRSGQNLLLSYDRRTGSLLPHADLPANLDRFTEIEIIGRGFAPDSARNGQISKLEASSVADMVAPLLPAGGARSISFISSHAEPVPPSMEGTLRSGFLHAFMSALRERADTTSLPFTVKADVANVTIDSEGEVRAVVATASGRGWRSWEAGFGRPVVEAAYGRNDTLEYRLNIHFPQDGASAIRDGLPDKDSGPLERIDQYAMVAPSQMQPANTDHDPVSDSNPRRPVGFGGMPGLFPDATAHGDMGRVFEVPDPDAYYLDFGRLSFSPNYYQLYFDK